MEADGDWVDDITPAKSIAARTSSDVADNHIANRVASLRRDCNTIRGLVGRDLFQIFTSIHLEKIRNGRSESFRLRV